MIPPLILISGAPWSVLPPGQHPASLTEVEQFFAINPHRRKLFAGLIAAAQALHDAGCKTIYLDGSYVTDKPLPADYDGCWDPVGVLPNKLDPVFLDFSNSRKSQKLKFEGNGFLFITKQNRAKHSFNFFQNEKHSGGTKGILIIDLTKESFASIKGGLK